MFWCECTLHPNLHVVFLQAKNKAKIALTQHVLSRKGSETFEIPSSDQLSAKRVDPAKLEVRFYILTVTVSL